MAATSRWEWRLFGFTRVCSGHLFFHNGDGITTVIKPATTFQKVAENKLGEYGLSSFGVVADGFVIRTEKHLVRLRR